MPRAALLSIHARVDGTHPSSWEDPSLVQLWGPRFSAYVVAARDRAVFSIGRLPDDARGRRIAEDIAARLHAFLAGRRMTYGEAGHGLGEHPNRLRYAATTGTVLIRWDGARQPTLWTVPPPELDSRDARRELAPPRYLHVFGPTTPAAFAKWAGIAPAQARGSVRRAHRITHGGANADRRVLDPDPRRAGVPRAHGARSPRPAPPQRRRVLPSPRSRSGAPAP
jgi:Winged helix DNA-binding domain